MTQEQKAKAYDKALEIARPYYEEAIKSEKTASIEFLESMFDELRDNDEKIRKEIIDYIKTGTYRKDWITWLENQGEKNPYSGVSFSYNDNTWGMCARDNGVDILFNKKLIEHISGEEQSEQKKSYDTCDSSMMDNKKSPYGEKRDFGYFEEKSDDTVKPKFKVGDWVVTSYGKVNQVIAVDVDEDLDGFILDDGTYFSGSWKDDYHLWTIKDAKDGDVLFVKNFDNIGGCVFLFNGLDSWKFDAEGDRAVATGYCCASITESGNTDFGIQGPDCVEIKRVHPASKDQRDLLFQKMHEAGYMWDSKSKQLLSLKAEPSGKQKPTWSEEDEKNLTQCIEAIDACYKWDSMIDWLKSLRSRSRWKPSEEQMRALHDMNLTGNISYAGQGQVLIELYNDLKKL